MRHENEEEKARSQAAQVERYWKEQGYVVNAWVEQVAGYPKGRGNGHASFWAVRSDMVGGHPTKRIGE